MKSFNLLVWLTQLGLSVALPPLAFILLSVWLRDRFGWGNWVIWTGIVIGIVCAIDGLRASLRAMERMAKDKKEQDVPVSFNDHD